MLHVLLHMSRENRPLTSEEIAKMLGTNATVVRRTMATLKSENYVSSEKGHGGGWQLSCNLKEITLLDVYNAIGKPTIFAIGIGEHNPDCLVEQVVKHRLEDALTEAETMFLGKLGRVSLADLEIELNSHVKGHQRRKREFKH